MKKIILKSNSSRFLRGVLLVAGIYNLVWGAAVIIFPNFIFNLAKMPPPMYPFIWQCVGMIVGVYGIGYYLASKSPETHWPIVFVGLLGKILGPIGFLQALILERFSPLFGWVILTNDLIWWVPFGHILWVVFENSKVKEV